MRIKIDKEVFQVKKVRESYLASVELEDGREFLIANQEQAENYVSERWLDMARNDPKEFATIIGDERLVKWALGHSDEYGISSLEEFVELTAQHCEGELATYDGNCSYVNRISPKLADELGVDRKETILAFRVD